MNILYVNPGRLESGLDAIIKGPPLALMTIAAMVPEHEARLFDFKVDKYNEQKFIQQLQWADVVAISSMTPQIDHALTVARMAKKEGAITILGGYHPTLCPEYVAKDEGVDFTARGEGEHTFKELIDFIDGNKNHVEKKDILGISYRNETGKVVHNADRPLEPNLDVFPIPRRDLIKGKHYQYLGTKVMLMETSRGCPHNCAFCCIIKMWRDNSSHMVYRKKSLKRVMEEVYSIDLDHWDFIFFNDDNFTIDVKRTDKILDMLIKAKLSRKVFFSCQSRVDTLNKNPWLAPKMAQAGFRQVFLGIESVHQQSLDAMGKHTNVPMIQNAVKMCTDNGMSIFGGMIIGFPGENKAMVRENIDFAISLGLDFVQFTPITAFPGTPFFDEMMKQKKIATLDYKYYNLFHPILKTDQLTRRQLFELVMEAYSKYYVNRNYLKLMAHRALKEPKFSWYHKIAFPWIKQFVFGGYKMLVSMGVFSISTADEARTNQIKRWSTPQVDLKARYRRFNLLKLYLVRLRYYNQQRQKTHSVAAHISS